MLAEKLEDTEESAPSPQHLMKKYSRRPWWLLVVLTALTPAISGFWSYRSATVESEAKSGEAKDEAEAGYKAAVAAVDELQKHDREYGKAISEMSGHLQAIEKFLMVNNEALPRSRRGSLRLPPAVGMEGVNHASTTKVQMPMDLKSALYDVNSGKVYQLGRVWEGPADEAPNWGQAETSPSK
jgi:hypothetical protein